MQQPHGPLLPAAERGPARLLSRALRRQPAGQPLTDPVREDPHGHAAKQQRAALDQVRRHLLRVRLHGHPLRGLGARRQGAQHAPRLGVRRQAAHGPASAHHPAPDDPAQREPAARVREREERRAAGRRADHQLQAPAQPAPGIRPAERRAVARPLRVPQHREVPHPSVRWRRHDWLGPFLPGQREPGRQVPVAADGYRAARHGQRPGAGAALGRGLHGRRGADQPAAGRDRGGRDHAGQVDGGVPRGREQGAGRHEAAAEYCRQREPGQHQRGQHGDLRDEQLLRHRHRGQCLPGLPHGQGGESEQVQQPSA